MDAGCSRRWMGGICRTNMCANTVLTVPDLHSVGSPLTLATTRSWEKYIDPDQNMSPYNCMTLCPLVAIC
jgi:hypothetical protein